MLAGIGAYSSWISNSTIVFGLIVPSSSFSSFVFTLPTETPAIRTSASVASVAASGNAASTR